VRRSTAAIGSAAFFAAAPGVVAGLIPWWITRWQVADSIPYANGVRWVGGVLLLLGSSVLVHAFAKFVIDGLGTPAPIAPTARLVIRGVYRYVRNPMYLAVLTVIAGQAMLFGSTSLVLYGAFIAVAFVLFVRFYEEPTLRATFGAEYDAYCRAVPRWWPRFRRGVSPEVSGASMSTDHPVACTLPATDYRARLTEIATLSRDALRQSEQRGLTLDLRYAPEAAARVRRLVEQERACCSFLKFELQENAQEVRLLVTAPPSAADVVPDLLAELTGRNRAEAP
jgi:protein-S-isoprenylcysteine O-methyltransferase Ste14